MGIDPATPTIFRLHIEKLAVGTASLGREQRPRQQRPESLLLRTLQDTPLRTDHRDLIG